MDRRVKERLVGASILVVFIVLIAPELLSGPAPAPVGRKLPVSAPEPVRNVTVDLATAKAPALEPAMDPATPGTAAAGAAAGAGTAPVTGATVPPPAAGPPATAAPPTAAEPAAAVAQRAAAAEPLESEAPAPTTPAAAVAARPAAAAHGWAVQLGSFASRANADKLARQVKGQGFSVFVLPGGSGTAQRYRVRIGPLADRAAAAQTEAKLKASGHVGTVVAPAT
jgi:DedD protein